MSESAYDAMHLMEPFGVDGDPINPNGDIAASGEFFDWLAPGGYLLMAAPFDSQHDAVYWNGHRMYGPIRRPMLMEDIGFKLLGAVWNGKMQQVQDLKTPDKDWTFEPVFVLQKPF